MSSICLNMIVKNEAHIMEQCLSKVADKIDYWVISDTGSTDGTQDVIRNFFASRNINGLLLEDEWVDFAHNRNLALDHALGKSDYILVMDADDYLEAGEDFHFENLTADSYMLKIIRQDITYYLPRLIRGNLPWRWKGVLHEYLQCNEAKTTQNLEGDYYINSTTDGARSHLPAKYLQDIIVLEQALVDEPDNARYRFYLAQSYRDTENPVKALENYELRAQMGGWPEEVYHSLLEIGRSKHLLNYDTLEVFDALMKAHQYRPHRLEALYTIVRLCREKGLFNLGYSLGIHSEKEPSTNDTLFVAHDLYEWRFLDELSICTANSGRLDMAGRMMEHLASLDMIPEDHAERIRANLAFVSSQTSTGDA